MTRFSLFSCLFTAAWMLAVPMAGASAPATSTCLGGVTHDLKLEWPNNSIINIVAFGHSVPAGFGVTPAVHKRDAYPRLLEDALAAAYPHAVFNVITAAVGGENSTEGLSRYRRDALDHHPRVVLIDYGLNDRSLPLATSKANLSAMIQDAREAGACPVLLTPTWDMHSAARHEDSALHDQARMIRSLGSSTGTPVADSYAAFDTFAGDRNALMAQSNHPNRLGHELIVQRLLPLFIPAP